MRFIFLKLILAFLLIYCYEHLNKQYACQCYKFEVNYPQELEDPNENEHELFRKQQIVQEEEKDDENLLDKLSKLCESDCNDDCINSEKLLEEKCERPQKDVINKKDECDDDDDDDDEEDDDDDEDYKSSQYIRKVCYLPKGEAPSMLDLAASKMVTIFDCVRLAQRQLSNLFNDPCAKQSSTFNNPCNKKLSNRKLCSRTICCRKKPQIQQHLNEEQCKKPIQICSDTNFLQNIRNPCKSSKTRKICHGAKPSCMPQIVEPNRQCLNRKICNEQFLTQETIETNDHEQKLRELELQQIHDEEQKELEQKLQQIKDQQQKECERQLQLIKEEEHKLKLQQIKNEEQKVRKLTQQQIQEEEQKEHELKLQEMKDQHYKECQQKLQQLQQHQRHEKAQIDRKIKKISKKNDWTTKCQERDRLRTARQLKRARKLTRSKELKRCNYLHNCVNGLFSKVNIKKLCRCAKSKKCFGLF